MAIKHLMDNSCRFMTLLCFAVNFQAVTAVAQRRPGEVEKLSGGTTFSAEQYKIDRMRSQSGSGNYLGSSSSFRAPMDFEKPKNEPKEDGSIWIGGYCRYRKPRYNQSRYHPRHSEIEYCRPVYPSDTIRQRDDFSGKGNIPWVADVQNSEAKAKCRGFADRMQAYLADGLPFMYYDSLQRFSWFGVSCGSGDCYTEGRDFEFSRSVHFWVKRKDGPDKMFIKFSAEFAYSCGDDNVYFEINDKGQFKIDVVYDNWKTNHEVVETGKAKSWVSGDWNEITISKDEFNTVSFFVNDVHVFHYQIPDIPITTRFSGFRLEMPYDWQKKKLQYNVGEVLVECYPKKSK